MNRATGGIYTPQKTVRAEERIAATWEASAGPRFPKGTQLEVYMAFDEDGTAVIVTPLDRTEKVSLRADVDNLVKVVLDGLNEQAWDDDSQVVKIVAVKS